MTINTHDLNLRDLKQASGKTVNWPQGSGGSTQIAWNRATGEIITTDHIGDSWTQYEDPDIITICHTDRHMTMQEIADAIAQAIDHD